MLAQTWGDKKHTKLLVKHPYLLSMKYDGVRGVWDGQHMRTRNGNLVRAPPGFLANIPPIPLDGELFTRRGGFSQMSAIIHRATTSDDDWSQVSYRVFDCPTSQTPYAETYLSLQAHLPSCEGSKARVCLVKQEPVADVPQLKHALQRELDKGGEGVMLRRADTPYVSKRTPHLIKVKGSGDAEAVVVGYQMGKGKYEDHLGALECVWQHDRDVIFNVGSGLTDRDRRQDKTLFPPGTLVTVSFMSLDPRSQRPRHPVYKGIRTDI